MTVKFNLNQIKQETIKNIEKILINTGLQMVADAKQTLIDNKNYSSGNLVKHTTFNVKGLTLEFGNNLEYANTIETGIINKQVNINDIKNWSKRKVELGHANKDILFFSKVITDKINKSGKIKNWHPFMRPALESNVRLMIEKIKKAIAQ